MNWISLYQKWCLLQGLKSVIASSPLRQCPLGTDDGRAILQCSAAVQPSDQGAGKLLPTSDHCREHFLCQVREYGDIWLGWIFILWCFLIYVSIKITFFLSWFLFYNFLSYTFFAKYLNSLWDFTTPKSNLENTSPFCRPTCAAQWMSSEAFHLWPTQGREGEGGNFCVAARSGLKRERGGVDEENDWGSGDTGMIG